MSALSENALYQELMAEIPQLQQQRDQSLIASLTPGKVSGTQASLAAVMSMLPMIIGAAMAKRKSQGLALGAAGGADMMGTMMKGMKEAGAEDRLLATANYKSATKDLKSKKDLLGKFQLKDFGSEKQQELQKERQTFSEEEQNERLEAAEKRANIMAGGRISSANIKAKGAAKKRKTGQFKSVKEQYTGDPTVKKAEEKMTAALYIQDLLSKGELNSVKVGAIRTMAPRAFGEGARMTDEDVNRNIPLLFKGEATKITNWFSGASDATLTDHQVEAIKQTLDNVINEALRQTSLTREKIKSSARYLAPDLEGAELEDYFQILESDILNRANLNKGKYVNEPEREAGGSVRPKREDFPSIVEFEQAASEYSRARRAAAGAR